jgi:hypothetical protein
MQIYSIYYFYPHEEINQCGFFDDYHLAKVHMELLKESFTLVEKEGSPYIAPTFGIYEYELNDTSTVQEIIEENKKRFEYYKKKRSYDKR